MILKGSLVDVPLEPNNYNSTVIQSLGGQQFRTWGVVVTLVSRLVAAQFPRISEDRRRYPERWEMRH